MTLSKRHGQHPAAAPGLPAQLLALGLAINCAFAVGSAHAQATDAGPRFAINSFAVEGNSLLGAAEVLSLLAPYTGTRQGFADVRRAVEALQAAYRKRGYNAVVVSLPEQELDKDVVRLQVTEARIGAVRVEGNENFDTTNIRASLPALREGTVPNVRDISASLKIANTNPAKQVTMALADGEAAGTIDATLRVRDEKPWRLGLTADNTGTPDTGRTRINALVQHANLFGRDHVASLQYGTSVEKPSQVSVYAAGYHLPLYALGDSMDFFASHSDVDSGSVTAGVLNLLVSGKGSTFGTRYNHTMPQWGDVASALTLGIDHRNYLNDIGYSGTQLGGDVTLHPLSLGWAAELPLAEAFANFQLTGVVNLPGGSGGRDADFAAQRIGATSSYKLLRLGGLYQRQLPQQWQLLVRGNGQTSRDALVAGEQFGAGGAGSVRGFTEREIAGDSGAFASVEVQTPNWCAATAVTALQCRALAFADGATVSRNNVQPGEDERTTISSLGLGLRLAHRHASLQVDLGRVLNGGGYRANGDTPRHVGLALSY